MAEPRPTFPWHPISSGDTTCTVHLIQAGGLRIPYDWIFLPDTNKSQQSRSSGADNRDDGPRSYYAPDYTFLIHHPPNNTTYLFDLGIRCDLQNLPPIIRDQTLPFFECYPRSPAAVLRQYGTPAQQPENIKAIITSHQHFDHVGDGGKQGLEGAEMWVGPTTCTYARPGYPVDTGAPTLSETLPVDKSRRVVELYVPDEILKRHEDRRAGRVEEGFKKGLYDGVDLKRPEWTGLGAFERAYDVFGDGSAYLIDAPGHSAGHQMMLVRTTASSSAVGDTFVLLAGDCYHHPDLLENPGCTARPPLSEHGMHAEPEVAIETMWRTKVLWERDEILVIGAHDFSVGNTIRPGEREIEGLVEINGWYEKGWKKSQSLI